MQYNVYKENIKRLGAGDGKFYYFYPYTAGAADETRVYYTNGTPCVRVEVSEGFLNELLEIDKEEYNNYRKSTNPKFIADPPVHRDEEFGEAKDNFWQEVVIDKRRYISRTNCVRRRTKITCSSE